MQKTNNPGYPGRVARGLLMIAFRLRLALQALAADGVVACPTEAVWGLSCDPWNVAAVDRLLGMKQRPAHKGLILVAADLAQVAPFLQTLRPSLQRKVILSWPGPNTWLLPHRDLLPETVTGEHTTVAVRVTAHPRLSALCRAWGGALVSTSANKAGSQAPRDLFQVRRYFSAGLDAVLPGAVDRAARPSVIRDVYSDRVLRS
ncbi:MAG: L-threonylcarbamoyladenylate synthase [Chromatocurvus sp.]